MLRSPIQRRAPDTAQRARWLLATVAFHGIAVADTVYSVTGRDPLLKADRAAEEAEMEVELDQGMYALIVGALVLLEEEVQADGRELEGTS